MKFSRFPPHTHTHISSIWFRIECLCKYLFLHFTVNGLLLTLQRGVLEFTREKQLEGKGLSQPIFSCYSFSANLCLSILKRHLDILIFSRAWRKDWDGSNTIKGRGILWWKAVIWTYQELPAKLCYTSFYSHPGESPLFSLVLLISWYNVNKLC